MAKKVEPPPRFLSGHCNPSNPPEIHRRCHVVAEMAPGLRPGVISRCVCPTCEHDRCPAVHPTTGARCRLDHDHDPMLRHREKPPGQAGVIW